MAAAAPALNAAGTNSWPSRASLRATNTSPGSRLRESMENPVTRSAGAPSASPCAAATKSSHCHSGSAIDGCLREGGPYRFVIREGQDARADDLPGLVALAGDQQQVAVAEQARAGADGLGAVADLPRAGSTRQDLGTDGLGPLAAGVVVGDDDVIGEACREAPHDRPLALVAVAATAEHAHEPAGGEGA